MAGIEHQRNGVRALRGDRGGEVADLAVHLLSRQIGGRGDLETGIGEKLRNGFRIVRRIWQRRHRPVGRFPDDKRNAVFGQRRMGAGKDRRQNQRGIHRSA